jgi:putative aminopeptidase FrvX
VQRAAAAAGLPLQIGLTQGGTDGTTFTFFGAPNTGLSWPGRYSHTPAEVLDLRDLERLARLITAVAQQRPAR